MRQKLSDLDLLNIRHFYAGGRGKAFPEKYWNRVLHALFDFRNTSVYAENLFILSIGFLKI